MIFVIIWIVCGVVTSILYSINCYIVGEFTLEDLLITLLLFCTGIAGCIVTTIAYRRLSVDFHIVLWKRKE